MKKLGFILILIFILLVVFQIIILKPEKYIENDMYDSIIERGFIKVGINTDLKPYGYIDENGTIIGYDADLARNIAQHLFNNPNCVTFTPVNTRDRLLKASTGEVDIVIATMTITPQRKEVINFSIPYDSAGMAILVKSNSKISSLSDLAGQNVGIIWGTTAEKSMLNLAPTANLIGFRKYNDAYEALKDDKICAITSDDTILNHFVLEDKGVKILPKRYTKEPYGIGFRYGKGTIKLKKALDYAINDMKQKNELNRLHKQWLESRV